MSAGFTPGPWQWFGNARNNDLYLATVNRGHLYVMGFERWGMRGAQPRFQPHGRGLVPASDLLMFEVGDQAVRGVAAAKADDSVYRLDIRGIDCPDAHLIAAAPDLYEALETLLAANEVLRADSAQFDHMMAIAGAEGSARTALRKARGEVS